MQLSPMKSVHRRIATALSILILASMACTFPGAATTPAPAIEPTGVAPVKTAAPAATATPARKAETLPPALVETDPPAGSRIGRARPVTFYFNQAMEPGAVEAALQGEPAPSGRFEWLDAATVRFTPDHAYPASVPVKFNFSTAAKAANGLALHDAAQVQFETAGPLSVAERLPKPGAVEANPGSAVIVTFTEPVVALGGDAPVWPNAFSLQPETAGTGEWINTSTYIFYPQTALKGGLVYTVTLNPGLQSSSGGALSLEGLNPAEWTFTTAMPSILSATYDKVNLARLDPKIVLTFNQPMDTASVEANFRIVGPAGVAVAGTFSWEENNAKLTFQPAKLLERDTRYTIQVLAAAAGEGGTPLGADFTLDFFTVPDLGVIGTTPAVGEPFYASYGSGSVGFNFSAPLKEADFASLVRIEPPVSGLEYHLNEDGASLFVYGAFNPSTTYNFFLSAAIEDVWGMRLGHEAVLSLTSERAEPALVLPSAGGQTIYLSDTDTNLQALATNLSVLNLELGKIDLATFIAISGYQPEAAYVLKPDYRWDLPVDLKNDTNLPIRLPLTPNRAPLAPGLYYLKASAPELKQQFISPYLLVVGRVQLTLKAGPNEITAWAVDLPGQTPLPNQKITFSAMEGEIASCTTDQDGLCRVQLSMPTNYYAGFYATTGKAGSPTFGMATTAMGVGMGAFEYGFATGSPDSEPLTYFYTDRPIYRPGQTVNFRVVLRSRDNGRYAALGVSELEVTVMPPYDGMNLEPGALTTLRLPVSEYGTVSGSFELPAGAAVGYYTIKTPTVENSFGISFQVAEYRKPEFELQTAFDKPEYLAGDPIHAEVNARYYFDAPTGNLPVTWTLFAAPDSLYLPGGLQTGSFDRFWLSAQDRFRSTLGSYITQGSSQTGPDGKLAIDIPADALAEIDRTQRQLLTIEVNGVDESGMPVSARTTALRHPAVFYAGVRAEVWGAQAGNEQGFSVQTVDWQGQPSGNHSLSAKLSKVVWERQDPPMGSYGGPTYTLNYTQVASSDFRTDGLGRARVAFTPPDPGVYQVEVSGEGALTQILIWVGGPGSVAWPSLPDQRLRIEADAAEYSPGQSAKIRIPNPFVGKALALVTVERSRVMYQRVFEISDSMVEETIPVDALYAPNAYVSVTLIGRKEDGSPDYRQGYLKLNVKADALKMNLDVKASSSRALPGEEITIALSASDAAGNPVRAEFSLALVDKAVLALADPNSQSLLDAFYGEQPLGVLTSLNLADYAGRMKAMVMGRGGGGGGDAMMTTTRTNFQDTALWVGTLETGADGKASQVVRLPDNLTTWVTDIRGLTVAALVGQAEIEVVTSKDLLVRPVTPRFLVAGDHLRLGAIVQNNTSESRSVLVTLEAPGLTLDTSVPSIQVEVPAQDRRRVDWWVTVQDVDAVDPLFTAEAGSLVDSTRLELGSLPVLRFHSPQTFATSGMLPDTGERLEVISLPRSFQPTGGELRVELSPSLAATVMESLKALENFPDETTEQFASRLLPNLAVYTALKQMNLQSPDVEGAVTTAIQVQIRSLLQKQNEDGGFGWNGRGTASEAYLSAYVLFAFNQAVKAGFLTNPDALSRLRAYLLNVMNLPTIDTPAWELDQLAMQSFVLIESTDLPEAALMITQDSLFELRQKLSPWAQALLAVNLEKTDPTSPRGATLVSDLESGASRSASGANWQLAGPDWHTWSTPNFNTAVVVYALARLDPAAPILTDAVRYLVLNRGSNGCWKSSYESAWVLFGLVEALQSTADLQASFNYSAELNGTSIAQGTPQTPASALKPVQAQIALSDLIADGPNALRIRRDAGDGRLYYRAFLEVDRPAESAPALESGISVRRDFLRDGQDCRAGDCQPTSEAVLGQDAVLRVRVTVIVPETMYSVVVEDTIPAGVEIINPNLKTSRQGFIQDGGADAPQYDLRDPFGGGWSWWLFGQARVLDNGVRWTAPYLPAGTYELTYRVVPTTAGEFRVLPAHAYQNYFPDVQGTSAGSIFVIR